jgi:hypothetical protein
MPNIAEIRQQYPQYQDLSDEQLAQGLHQKFYSDMPFEEFSGKIGLSAPVATPQKQVGAIEDAINSVAYRGLPEAIAASTPLGFGANIIRGASDATRWLGGKVYKGFTGEGLPHYTENPIPSSSDMLQSASQKLLGKNLYEPKTLAGEYANTVAQFGAGGKILGAPLSATIPAAVASETAGQLTKGTGWEIPARLAAAVVVGNYSANRGGREPVKTASEVRQGATNLFKQAEQEGANIPAATTNSFIDDASALLPQTEAGKLVLGKNSATELVDRIQGLRDQPLTLAAAQEIDSGLGRLISKEIDPRSGKLNAEGQQIYSIQQKLRDSVDNLPEQPGLKTLKKAKAEWAKQARMSDLERIVEFAENTDNPTTSIRSGARTLINNKKRFGQYNKQEQAAIRHMAKTGIATGALRIVGSRLISTAVGAASGAAGGGFLGGMAGATVGGGIGYGARELANKRQIGRANQAIETVANRGQPAPQNPLMQIMQQDTGINLKPSVRVPAGKF